jgi:hypothetical protein
MLQIIYVERGGAVQALAHYVYYVGPQRIGVDAPLLHALEAELQGYLTPASLPEQIDERARRGPS